MHKINLKEAGTQFENLVAKAISGEDVIIFDGTQPLVKLVSLIAKQATPKRGSAKGLIKISADFDAPLEELRDFM